ncbi:MAG TPA: sigma-70 family RNA polymerase sigma factor [Streptosporangiaceae bacterium]|nr:sigma-70 family RNA polymerase sigma factor [Streptosporangiaceae bacterium]
MSIDSRFRGDERTLLQLARQGDESAFGDLTEVHRGALTAHCYQMLGSFADAEDAVQDALLRAWRALGNFEGRSSVRSWLYSIVTNTALDVARSRRRRELSAGHGSPARPGAGPAEAVNEPIWLEPFPDRTLTSEVEQSPEARYELRESLELAFVVALQQLPPLQRAVLILREVVGFSAAETASQLATSVPAVNSALQRARATISGLLPAQSQQTCLRSLGDEKVKSLAQRYADAIERGDTKVLVNMLTAEATWSMPPSPTWYHGHDRITEFLTTYVFGVDWRHAATSANGQLAVGCYIYDQDQGYYLGSVVDVLTLEGDRIAAVTGFQVAELLRKSGADGAVLGTEIFPQLGLPFELPKLA